MVLGSKGVNGFKDCTISQRKAPKPEAKSEDDNDLFPRTMDLGKNISPTPQPKEGSQEKDVKVWCVFYHISLLMRFRICKYNNTFINVWSKQHLGELCDQLNSLRVTTKITWTSPTNLTVCKLVSSACGREKSGRAHPDCPGKWAQLWAERHGTGGSLAAETCEGPERGCCVCGWSL